MKAYMSVPGQGHSDWFAVKAYPCMIGSVRLEGARLAELEAVQVVKAERMVYMPGHEGKAHLALTVQGSTSDPTFRADYRNALGDLAEALARFDTLEIS